MNEGFDNSIMTTAMKAERIAELRLRLAQLKSEFDTESRKIIADTTKINWLSELLTLRAALQIAESEILAQITELELLEGGDEIHKNVFTSEG